MGGLKTPMESSLLLAHLKPPKGARDPMSRSRASEKERGKERDHVARFCATKRSELSSAPFFREAQGSLPKADQVTWAPFLLVRFLWACKENERKSFFTTREDGFKSEINYLFAGVQEQSNNKR